MSTTKYRLQELLKLYLQQAISEMEKAELWDYINDPLYTSEIQDLLSRSFDHEDGEIALEKDRQQTILSAIFSQTEIRKEKKVIHHLWPRIAVAASVAIVIFTAGYLYFSSHESTNTQAIAKSKRIVPATNSAKLTLSNGKEIILSDAVNGELANEYGVLISKTADGKLIYKVKESNGSTKSINTLTTARGETYDVVLPDGTLVTLNAGSSLKYPSSFTASSKRKVELSGEAFFDVAKDKRHPFVVTTVGQEIEVLGTHFNISAYLGEATKTTLIQGSVKVSSTFKSDGVPGIVILKPGQMATSDGEKINIIDLTNINNQMAWKNGYFVFNGKRIEDVMKEVSRWYDVDIEYQGNMSHVVLGGSVSRSKSIEELLAKIEFTGSVHFKIIGRRIIVTL